VNHTLENILFDRSCVKPKTLSNYVLSDDTLNKILKVLKQNSTTPYVLTYFHRQDILKLTKNFTFVGFVDMKSYRCCMVGERMQAKRKSGFCDCTGQESLGPRPQVLRYGQLGCIKYG